MRMKKNEGHYAPMSGNILPADRMNKISNFLVSPFVLKPCFLEPYYSIIIITRDVNEWSTPGGKRHFYFPSDDF